MVRAAGGAAQTLVEQCLQWAKNRMDGQVFRPGMRLPSIRTLARERGVSPFTIVETYERLVASGYLEARRGSGFYVRRRAPDAPAQAPDLRPKIDLAWLMSHMLERGAVQGPGLGVLPASWLDGAKLGDAVRSLGRQGAARWLESGTPQGFAPLRSVLQERLAQLDIIVRPEQIVLTTGITHALNLVLRAWINPGDAVLTLDPSWFGALGMLSTHGARVIGVPCTPDGPDLAVMERLAREERPRLLLISSAAHNPTGLSLTPAAVTRILDIAARHDLLIFEDDVYGDLCDSNLRRLAAEDRQGRVIFAGSFSKTLAANVRVGFLACSIERAQALAQAKILTGFTTPEMNERLVHKMLVEGRYARHVEQLRERLTERRAYVKRTFAREGVEVFGDPVDGMFAWVDMRTDTNELATAWRERNLLLAPGSLFSPHQVPSSWMRFNVTTAVEGPVATLLRSVRRTHGTRRASRR